MLQQPLVSTSVAGDDRNSFGKVGRAVGRTPAAPMTRKPRRPWPNVDWPIWFCHCCMGPFGGIAYGVLVIDA